MLPPHELKNKKFPLAIRGYAQTDVNDYIEFLIEKYTDAYKRNDELERELRQTKARLEELEGKEDAINRALINAQKLHDRILSDAQREAQVITSAAKQSTGKTLSDFTEKIRRERATLLALTQSTAEFKTELLEEYNRQISLINAISAEVDDSNWDKSDAEFVTGIMNDIRKAAENALSPHKPEEEPQEQKSEVGEFAGILNNADEGDLTFEIKPKKRRPRAIRIPKELSEYEKNEDNITSFEANNNTDETDENLRKLFSD